MAPLKHFVMTCLWRAVLETRRARTVCRHQCHVNRRWYLDERDPEV